MFTRIVPALAGVVLCAAATGCVAKDPDPVDPVDPGVPTGTLTTTWTLDGSSGVGVCDFYQVDRVRVSIVDDAGFLVEDEEPFCEESVVSFDMSVGWYSSEVTLLDAGGYAVSDTIITEVRVVRDTEVFVDVDFPDGAIL